MRVYIAAFMNATIVGLSLLFTKIALEATTPLDTLGYRFLVAWLCLTLYMTFFKSQKIKVNFKDIKQILSLTVLALFYPTLFFSFQALGLNYTTSAEGGIILAFSPALTALFASMFLKEKLNLAQFFFIFLSIFGVVYIFLMSGVSISISGQHWVGIVFLFISSVSIAGYAVLARYLSVSFTPFQLSYVMVTFGVIFFNIVALVQIDGRVIKYFQLAAQLDFLGAIVFLGIFATMLTSFLSNYVLSKLSAAKMSIFSNLSTVISIIAGAVFLSEDIYLFHIIGSVMIIVGVLGTNFYKGKNTQLSIKEQS